ncbi:MAG: transporter, partial [Mycobacterium sp.]|nr:transporter [Mycobacterium sp.]
MSTRVDVVPTPATAPRRAWFALAVLLLPVLLIAVDNTILAFALPSIAQDFTPS